MNITTTTTTTTTTATTAAAHVAGIRRGAVFTDDTRGEREGQCEEPGELGHAPGWSNARAWTGASTAHVSREIIAESAM